MGHDGNLAGKLSHELSGGCFPQPCHGVLYRTHMWHIRTLTHPCLTAAATSPSRTPLPTAQSKTRRLSLPRHQRPFLRAPYCGSVAPAFSSGPDHGDTSPAPRLPPPSPSAEGRAGLCTRLYWGKGRASRSPEANSPAPPRAKGTTPLSPEIKTRLLKQPLCARQPGTAPPSRRLSPHGTYGVRGAPH